MCSRYNLTSPHEAVRAYFGYGNDEAFPPRPEIRPTEPVAIVRNSEKGGRELTLVRWGLIPGWLKDPSKIKALINARAESVLEKPSFRAGIRHRRCLVPADGFYEWSGPARAKRMHLIRPRAGGLMALAGLWDHWLGADGSEIETMAIVTVAANATVAPVHDRMPAILAPAQFDVWLDARGTLAEAASDLLRPAPADLLEVVDLSPQQRLL